jgi:hypothetical protein
MNDVGHSVSIYQTIRDRIIAVEAGIDDATLSDTLEGLTDLNEVLAAVVRSALLDEAMAEGLKAHIKTLQDRLERLLLRATARREISREAMLEVDLKTVKAPDFTLTLRPGSPAVVVIDEKAIPDGYWEPREPRLDRYRLLTDLKYGVVVDGAILSNPEPVLSVRIR